MTSIRSSARVLFVALSLVLGSLAASSQAAMILNANFVDNARPWDAVTQNVVLQAIDDWQSVIGGVVDEFDNVQSITINFDVEFFNFGNAGPLGQFAGNFSAFAGASILPWSQSGQDGVVTMTRVVRFNSSLMEPGEPNQLWWDPDPSGDGSAKPFSDWDALSVARHEIGHMLGFSGLYRHNFNQGNEERIFPSHVVSDVFDPGGLNVAMEPGDPSHIADSNFLMYTTLSNTDGRVDISATELAMLSLAYNYHIVPEPSTLTMLVLGSITAVGLVRRRQRGNAKWAA